MKTTALRLQGLKFDRLMVVEEAGRRKGNVVWKCLCDCGNFVCRTSSSLRRSNNASCGCYNKERLHLKKQDNPRVDRRIYKTYIGMKQRCYNKKNKNYIRYGGRGIKVSEEFNSFDKFEEWALKNGYDDNLTIERIDVNGDYTPGNCTWIPISKQASNTRRNYYVVYSGEKVRLKDLCDKFDLNYNLVFSRLDRGWCIEDAVHIKRLSSGEKLLDVKRNEE